MKMGRHFFDMGEVVASHVRNAGQSKKIKLSSGKAAHSRGIGRLACAVNGRLNKGEKHEQPF
jgi:hypothetical protein